jgi:hypothetical protein
MDSTTRRPPRITASVYVPLRPDGGILTVECIRRTPIRIDPGSRVILSAYGLRSWDPGAAELLGRILADGGADQVFVQASCSSRRLEELRSAIAQAAEAWCAGR